MSSPYYVDGEEREVGQDESLLAGEEAVLLQLAGPGRDAAAVAHQYSGNQGSQEQSLETSLFKLRTFL